MAAQSRAAKYVQKRSYTRLAAFSSRGAGRLSSSNLASAASRSASSNSSTRLIRSPSTVDRLDLPPLGLEAPCEVPCAAWVTTAPRSLSRCTASMWIADVWRRVPTRHGCMRSGHRARMRSPAGGRCSPSPASSRRLLVPIERGVGLRDDRPCVARGRRLAGEVSGVEFREGGVDVVERRTRRAPRSGRRRRSRRRRALRCRASGQSRAMNEWLRRGRGAPRGSQ